MVSIAQLPNVAAEKGALPNGAISGAGQTSHATNSAFADVLQETRSLHPAMKIAPGKSEKTDGDANSSPAREASQTASSRTQPNGDTQPNAQTIPLTTTNPAVGQPTVPMVANATASLPQATGIDEQSASVAAAQTTDEGIGVTSALASSNVLAIEANQESTNQSAADMQAAAGAHVPDASSSPTSPMPPENNGEQATGTPATPVEHGGAGANGPAAKSNAENLPDTGGIPESSGSQIDFAPVETDSILPQQAATKDISIVATNLAGPAAKQSVSAQRDSEVEGVPSIPAPYPADQSEIAVGPSGDGREGVAPIVAPPTSGESAVQVNQAVQKAQSNDRERIFQEITSGLQKSLKDIQTVAPTIVAAASSNGKVTGSSAPLAAAQTAAQDSSKQPGNEAPGSNSGRSDNSNANAQKTSILESATAVKAAGQSVVSVDQPLHVPADAPAQTAGASAGSVLHQSASTDVLSADANSSTNAKPLPYAFTPLPTSQADVVKASELYQRVGGAEMHISMDTELLGSIDLRTVVHQSTVTTTIGVQRSDVQTLLTNELPALQHALSQRSLHVEQISVLDSTIGARTGFGGNSQQHQNAPSPHALAMGTALDTNSSWMEESQIYFKDVSDAGIGAGRLSVHV